MKWFNYILYCTYKMYMDGKEYKDMPLFATSFAIGFPLTILLGSIILLIERYFQIPLATALLNKNKYLYIIVFGLPVVICVYFYGGAIGLKNIYEKRITRRKTFIDKTPGFIIYFLFVMLCGVISAGIAIYSERWK